MDIYSPNLKHSFSYKQNEINYLRNMNISGTLIAFLKGMKHIGIKRLAASDVDVICMYCKKIKNSGGQWYQGIQRKKALSHGICPECLDGIWKPQTAAALNLSESVLGSIAKITTQIAG